MTRASRGAIALAFAVQVLACASPNLDRDMRYTVPGDSGSGPLIEVRPFALDVSAVKNVADAEWLEIEIGQALVRSLRGRGRRALLSAGDAPPRGQVIVRGRIVRARGRSRAERVWAGPVVFGVTGQYLRPSGDVVGEFNDERVTALGLHEVVAMDRCVERVAQDLTDQILEADWSR